MGGECHAKRLPSDGDGRRNTGEVPDRPGAPVESALGYRERKGKKENPCVRRLIIRNANRIRHVYFNQPITAVAGVDHLCLGGRKGQRSLGVETRLAEYPLIWPLITDSKVGVRGLRP